MIPRPVLYDACVSGDRVGLLLKGVPMIVRTWRCWATIERADEYAAYLTGTVFAGLQQIAGHRGAQLLRREDAGRIEFVAISHWDTAEAIQQYAGADISRAMVKPEARAMLAGFDEIVNHYDLGYDTTGIAD
jgi:heme-degrading monooxygenase HmoA